jgi:hypothetical protein
MTPISHWDHNRFLIHFEMTTPGEVKATLPRIPEPVGPFAWMAVLFVPAVFLRPQPTLSPQG